VGVVPDDPVATELPRLLEREAVDLITRQVAP
jgi:hypothetical protein